MRLLRKVAVVTGDAKGIGRHYARALVGALIFLVPSESDFMTGRTLHVDEGSVLT